MFWKNYGPSGHSTLSSTPLCYHLVQSHDIRHNPMDPFRPIAICASHSLTQILSQSAAIDNHRRGVYCLSICNPSSSMVLWSGVGEGWTFDPSFPTLRSSQPWKGLSPHQKTAIYHVHFQLQLPSHCQHSGLQDPRYLHIRLLLDLIKNVSTSFNFPLPFDSQPPESRSKHRAAVVASACKASGVFTTRNFSLILFTGGRIFSSTTNTFISTQFNPFGVLQSRISHSIFQYSIFNRTAIHSSASSLSPFDFQASSFNLNNNNSQFTCNTFYYP